MTFTAGKLGVAVPGKSFGDKFPNHVDFWKPENNPGINPCTLPPNSTVYVKFECHLGHWWTKRPADIKTEEIFCPVCRGFMTWAGFNDIESQSPELLRMWDWEKNTLLPSEVRANESRNIYWKCPEKSHQFDSAPKSTFGCPVCSNRRTVSSQNDLETTNPEVLPYWDYERNDAEGLYPNKVNAGGKQTANWFCREAGHRMKQLVAHFVSQSHDCARCHGRGVEAGVDDLETLRPNLMLDYDYANNPNPKTLALGSHEEVNWDCHVCHYYWTTEVRHRAKDDRGCANCLGYGTSAVEKRLRDFVKNDGLLENVNPNHLARVEIESRGKRKTIQVDVFGETSYGQKVAIEYDGSYWHEDRLGYDKFVTYALLNEGYVLIRIRESTSKHKANMLGINHANLHIVEYEVANNYTNFEFVLSAVKTILEGLNSK